MQVHIPHDYLQKRQAWQNRILYGLTNSFLRVQLLLVLRDFLGLYTGH